MGLAVPVVVSATTTETTTTETTTTEATTITETSNLDKTGVNGINIFEQQKFTKPQVPYFYYWTYGENVFLNWDYGSQFNRPYKIEVVIDDDLNFSSPDYVEVKPKGAEFTPSMSGPFYLRIRFLDENGSITHESIRKVFRGTEETREIIGLTYVPEQGGVLVNWANFKDGINSAEISIDGQIVETVNGASILNNEYLITGVSEGSEVRIKIINGKGVEYNGVIFVKSMQGGLSYGITSANLSSAQNGVGILVNLANTGFKKGTEFVVDVVEKESGDSVVSGYQVILDQDEGSFVIYPDEGKRFLNEEYIVTIQNRSNGRKYVIDDYLHKISSDANFSAIPLPSGQVLLAWDQVDGAQTTQVIWSNSATFDTATEELLSGNERGIVLDTKSQVGEDVYIILTTFDKDGRVITQDLAAVRIDGDIQDLSNFTGKFINDNTVQFTLSEPTQDVISGILDINGTLFSLRQGQIDSINNNGMFDLSGFNKGNKYEVTAYLLDETGKVHKGFTNVSGSGGHVIDTDDLFIQGDGGINARYTINPGILTLVLDESFNFKTGSPINLDFDGHGIGSIKATYVPGSNSINISGLIPSKEYTNIVISYIDSNGNTQRINFDELYIKRGSHLDGFIINMYNNAVSRSTQNIDETGYNYWKYGMINKEISLGGFVRNLAYVPEFMDKVNSPEDVITRLYLVLVDRNPDKQGLDFWTSVYNQLVKEGVSHKDAVYKLILQMTSSPEFSNLAKEIGVEP